jgi:hypothetical protein
MASSSATPLTKVELEYRAEEFHYRLLFGQPLCVRTLLNTFGHTRQEAWFSVGSLFALDLWQGAPIRNASGELRTRTTARACLILQAGNVGERLEPVPQVQPGARVLVRTQGQRRCKFFLDWITALKGRCEPTALDPEFFDLKSIAIRCLIPERDAPEAIGFPAHAAAP